MLKRDCFVAGADLHIHSRRPENRKGDYFSQVIAKFAALLEIVVKHSSPKLLVIAGDFFDSSQAPYKVTNTILEMIMDTEVNILVVPGQHDLRYHVSGLNNTPLGTLVTAKRVSIITPERNNISFGGISFIGAGWNEEPQDAADVLVIHRMVTKSGELWPGQKNYSSAHAILRKYPWANCIISGDNHKPHSLRVEGGDDGHRLQINCGSMMRTTTLQLDFQPRVYLVDITNWQSKAIKIPCEPSEDVFDFNKIEEEDAKEIAKKQAEELIEKFIDTLPKDEEHKPNFVSDLQFVIEQVKPRKSVLGILNEIMEKIKK